MDSPVISSLQVKGSGQDLSSRNVDFSHEKSRGGNRQGVAGSLPPPCRAQDRGAMQGSVECGERGMRTRLDIPQRLDRGHWAVSQTSIRPACSRDLGKSPCLSLGPEPKGTG